jgi:MoxR-like ATPase
MVVATQNPIEYEGTYPLPEAQLDRFTFKVTVDHGPLEVEEAVLARYQDGFDARALDEVAIEPVLDHERLVALREECRRVAVEPSLLRYIARLVRGSRELADVQLGASPRAGIALLQGGKAAAALEGRGYVLPDDVKRLARPVLRHRLMLRPEAELDGLTPDLVVERLLGTVELPR